jgi:hypothetical protein
MDPAWVSRDSEVVSVGLDGYFGGIRLDGGQRPYEVLAWVPIVGEQAEGGLSQNRLRAAGTDYPGEIVALYTQVPDGAIGPDGEALIARIRELAPDSNPFDIADTAVNILRGRTFTYDTDLRDVTDCQTLGAVECFARYKRGYCLHYASTMAVLLREMGIPTRLAEGFLPGTRDSTGREAIASSAQHAWVEVYFPGYGWVAFDPTGGGVAQAGPLPSGAPPASTRPSAVPLTRPPETDPDVPPAGGGQLPPGSTTSRGGDAPLLIAIAVVLLLAVSGLAFVAWQRGPRGDLTADGVWRSIARTAGRFGFGPRPTQTVYEYAGSLGDVLPASKPELQTVARAKVEVAYGRRILGDDGMRALRDAQRRLRVGLLRLALRRKERRARRRGRST